MTFGRACLFAMGTGFVALSYQILWYRAFGYANQSLPSTFALLLGAFLLGLTLGAAYAQATCTRFADAAGLEAVRARLVWAGLAAPFACFLVVPLLSLLRPTMSPLVALFGVVLAAGISGAMLPMLSHVVVRADRAAGERISFLYLANIVGSASGSFLTGTLALRALPLTALASVFLILGLALVPLASAHELVRVRWLALIAGAGAILAASSGLVHGDLWHRLLPALPDHPVGEFVYLSENEHGVVSLDANGNIYGSGVYDGTTNVRLDDDTNGIARLYALGSMLERPRRVMMIGLGGGAWTRVVAELPGVESIVVAELDTAYLEVVRRSPDIAPMLEDDRITFVWEDGRRYLLTHQDEQYDLVIANTSWSWRANATNVLSTEFHALVRSRLAANGVYYFNGTESPDAIRTAVDAWPHTFGIGSLVACSERPLVFDAARFARLIDEVRVGGTPIYRTIAARDRVLAWAAAPGGALADGSRLQAELGAAGTVITDDNMASEWHEIRLF